MAKKTKKILKSVDKSVTSLDVAKKAIIKKYGNVLTTLGEGGATNIQTISSGSLGLDVALGRGGFARGRIYEIFGPPSGGKTTLTMSVIAEAQKRGLNAVFCDAEHSADPELFKAMDVDIGKLLLVRAFIGDDNLDALEILLKTNEVDIAVVDSVSALIPKDEAAAEMSDQFMGLLARLMSKAMRKFVPIVSETGALLIFINQIRYKIGSWGDPTTTTGGEALNFYSTGRIEVSGGEYKNSRIPNPITGEIIGHNTKFEIKKNKLAPPFRTAKIPLIYGIGYDNVWECLILAEGLGIIDKAGAWYSYNGERVGQGELNALNFLKENEDIYKSIREEIIDITGLKGYYDLNK